MRNFSDKSSIHIIIAYSLMANVLVKYCYRFIAPNISPLTKITEFMAYSITLITLITTRRLVLLAANLKTNS